MLFAWVISNILFAYFAEKKMFIPNQYYLENINSTPIFSNKLAKFYWNRNRNRLRHPHYSH
jgi:hypothetical protein